MNLGRIRIGRLAAHSGARRTRRGQFRSRIRRCNPCCFLGLLRRRRLSSRIRQRFRCVLGFQNCRIRGGLRGRDNGRLCRHRGGLGRNNLRRRRRRVLSPLRFLRCPRYLGVSFTFRFLLCLFRLFFRQRICFGLGSGFCFR